ncbi:YdcH family protein, partial [Aeromonas dhakensis]
MFPEYRELISQLKSSDVHFQKKFDLHNDLDVEIRKLEKHHASD